MFHAFYVAPGHRDALRFHWWSGNDPKNKVTTWRANVHIFGARSSPAVSTYGLRHTTSHPCARGLQKACSVIKDNFYVDDCLASAPTVAEAVSALRDTREILSKFNIRLHKIVSPEKKLLQAFPTSELGLDLEAVDFSLAPAQTALCVSWAIDRTHSISVSRSQRESSPNVVS